MIIALGIRNLLRNYRRTLAILVTVGMGTGSLYIFHGFNFGIMNQYRDNTVHSRYGHGQINLKGYRGTVFEKPWEHWITNFEQIQSVLTQTPSVTHVFPRMEFFGLLTNGKITVSGKGQGVDGVRESQFFNTLNVEQGKNLSDEADGILLGKGLATALSVKPGDRVTVLGNTIHGSINGLDLIVTGIFHTGSKDFDDVVFRLPLVQAQTLLDTQSVESIALGLTDISHWNSVAHTIEAKFPELEATPFAVLDKVYYQHSVDWLNSQFAITQIIILSIVILGIFNTVATMILERKQEIGNLRANGESKFDVFKLLAIEGLTLGFLGAILGIAVAWILNNTALQNGILMPPAPGLTRQFHVKIELQPQMAFICFTMGVLCAGIGTAIAGARVAKKPISELLRSV